MGSGLGFRSSWHALVHYQKLQLLLNKNHSPHSLDIRVFIRMIFWWMEWSAGIHEIFASARLLHQTRTATNNRNVPVRFSGQSTTATRCCYCRKYDKPQAAIDEWEEGRFFVPTYGYHWSSEEACPRTLAQRYVTTLSFICTNLISLLLHCPLYISHYQGRCACANWCELIWMDFHQRRLEW